MVSRAGFCAVVLQDFIEQKKHRLKQLLEINSVRITHGSELMPQLC